MHAIARQTNKRTSENHRELLKWNLQISRVWSDDDDADVADAADDVDDGTTGDDDYDS